MAQDDEIDTEALQAQIDLSMSFTHELISSWIKPSKKSLNSSYNQNLEAELKDYMRRPPRLGVGAPIPETNSVTSRETARLKGQLTGKALKRPREDDGEPSSKQLSDDEGESRAGAIKKKAKMDPFGVPAGKKKNPFRINDVGPSKMVDISPSANNLAEEKRNVDGVDKAERMDDNASMPSLNESPRKKKKRKHGLEENSVAAPSNTTPTQNTSSVEAAHTSGDSKESLSLVATNPASLPNSPAKAQNPRATSLLVQSVLNLDGPVREDESGSDEPDSTALSPKKKRKRRKRKKHIQGSIVGGAS